MPRREVRLCKDCRYCHYKDKDDCYICHYFAGMQVCEDDFCSFGGDIKPEYGDEDGEYERHREHVWERIHSESD